MEMAELGFKLGSTSLQSPRSFQMTLECFWTSWKLRSGSGGLLGPNLSSNPLSCPWGYLEEM